MARVVRICKTRRDFDRAVARDRAVPKKNHGLTYLPETYCWVDVIQDKKTAVMFLLQLLMHLPKEDYPTARRILEFAMKQKTYSKVGINKSETLVDQLRKGTRLATSVWPSEIDPVPMDMSSGLCWTYGTRLAKQTGEKKLVYVTLRENADLIPFLRRNFHTRGAIRDAVEGLAYGFGPVAVANFCLTVLSNYDAKRRQHDK